MAGANLTVGAKHTEFKRAMGEVNNELKNLKSEFNLASTKAKLFGSETDKLKVKQQELTSKISLQEKQMKIVSERINKLKSDNTQYASTQKTLTDKIEQTNKKYKESVDATGKNSAESKKLKTELDKLKQEYENNEKAIVKNNKQLQNAKTQLNNTEAALLENKKALDSVSKSIKDAPWDKMSKKLDTVGQKATAAGKKMSVLSGALAGVGGASVVAFKEVDTGIDNVIKATGATGEAAKELEGNFKNVATTINAEFGTIGSTLGEVNTRFSFTGKELEDCSTKFLEFARINNTDATQAVQLVSRAMGDAGIESSKYGEVLDQLTAASQKSGISVDKLTELLTKYGAPMRALGMDTKESIAIFSSWELAGVNTEIAFSGMKAAIGKWGKEGKDARVEFKKTLKEIESAPNIAVATSKAIEIFGQKAGPDLADAIKGGRFEYEDFLKALDGSGGTVTNTFNQVQDGTDKFGVAMNSVKIAGGELGEVVLTSLSPMFEGLATTMQKVATWFGGLNDGTKQAIVVVGGLVAAIGPGLIIFGAMASGLSKIVKGFKDIKDISTGAIGNIKKFGTSALSGAKAAGNFVLNLGKMALGFAKTAVQAGLSTVKLIAHKVATLASTIASNGLALAQAALNFVMSLNPITLIIIAIGALVAAVVVLWNKCDWFRNLVMAMFDGLKVAWNATIEFFKGIWNGFVAVWQMAVEGFKSIWNGVCAVFKVVWQGVCLYFQTVWTFWKTIFTGVVTVIKGVWNGACSIFKSVWQGVCTIFSNLFNGFKNTFTSITNGIKSIWNAVCNFFKSTWTGACNGIKSVFTGVKNTVVGIAQAMTNTVIRAINWCIRQLNKIKFTVPSWVPLIGGKSWGVNIAQVSEVSWLYKGGIIDRPTVLPGGIGVGDSYKGKGRQAEAIIPLDQMYRNIKNIVKEEVNKTTSSQVQMPRELKANIQIGGQDVATVITPIVSEKMNEMKVLKNMVLGG